MILNCQIFVYKNEMAALQKAVQSMGQAFAATEMSGFPARSYTPQICITHLLASTALQSPLVLERDEILGLSQALISLRRGSQATPMYQFQSDPLGRNSISSLFPILTLMVPDGA